MTNNEDDRIRLTVLGLSYSQIQTGAYALILAEADGPMRIPVVIGAAEAQSIAISLENIKPTRPMTHDLFVSASQAFGIRMLEVFIYKFEDGVFSSEITLSDGERTVVVDSRTSDAIAIAMRTHSSIFTTREIIEATGFIMEVSSEDTDSDIDDDAIPQSFERIVNTEPKMENLAIEELERELNKAIEREDYETAAKINNIIEEKKRGQL